MTFAQVETVMLLVAFAVGLVSVVRSLRYAKREIWAGAFYWLIFALAVLLPLQLK